MEHRHERRIACRFDIELRRKNTNIGSAKVKDVSKSGLCIQTGLTLDNKELVQIKFPEKASLFGWPEMTRAIVLHAENDSIGLLFDGNIFKNLEDLQRACDEISY